MTNLNTLTNPALYIASLVAARSEEAKRLEQLKIKLLVGANSGLGEANKGNQFWTKKDAMTSINGARKLIAS